MQTMRTEGSPIRAKKTHITKRSTGRPGCLVRLPALPPAFQALGQVMVIEGDVCPAAGLLVRRGGRAGKQSREPVPVDGILLERPVYQSRECLNPFGAVALDHERQASVSGANRFAR
jgi:hypothetical protein